ncbi:MAG: hypothetical protein K0Q43_453 [Ramlibacter sp.]|jgi:hypothetical protein|nr:hypothetical protein [Ramlibacter sp.]
MFSPASHSVIKREAVWGHKVSWHGLAIAAFYFPGFMLGLFYLAWGPVFHKRVFAHAGIPRA